MEDGREFLLIVAVVRGNMERCLPLPASKRVFDNLTPGPTKTMLAIRAVGLRYALLTPRIIQRSGKHGNITCEGQAYLIARFQPYAGSKPKA